MQNARLDEAQTRIKIARRNNSNLRYADDITLMAKSEEKLKSLLMKVKEKSEKAGLKVYNQKTKNMVSGPSLHGKEMGIPDHLTFLLRNLYAGQEATVRTGHGTMHWFQIGKGVHQGCILLPCLFTYMQNTSCKMQAG